MAGLVLKLAPNERILINGVVMENGERKATLRIKTPDASILRLRDALHPDDAVTPVTRAYYAAQMRVAGETDAADALATLAPQLEALVRVFVDTQHASVVGAAIDQLRRRNFYGVMRSLQPLIAVEREMLSSSGDDLGDVAEFLARQPRFGHDDPIIDGQTKAAAEEKENA